MHYNIKQDLVKLKVLLKSLHLLLQSQNDECILISTLFFFLFLEISLYFSLQLGDKMYQFVKI
jgi:hypothetical protein